MAGRVRRFLYDTSVFVYALDGEHPYREPCRDIVHRAARNIAKLVWWHHSSPMTSSAG